MLSPDGIIARFIFSFCFYFISATGMVTGNVAAISGILGTMALTSALMRYSPLIALLEKRSARRNKSETEL